MKNPCRGCSTKRSNPNCQRFCVAYYDYTKGKAKKPDLRLVDTPPRTDAIKATKAIPENCLQDIKCWRENNETFSNVPHRITWHSATGYEWGYEGSGPAEFALNILSLFIGGERAFPLHQEFKRRFVSALPPEGGTISKTEIMEWIQRHTTKQKGSEGDEESKGEIEAARPF